MLLAVALAAVVAAAQATPPHPSTIPIPTGEVGREGWFGGVEASTQLLFRFVFGHHKYRDGGGREVLWRAGGLSGSWAASVDAGEITRTTRLKRTSPGPGPAAVTRTERYIANGFAAVREAYQSRCGRHVNVSYWWYPIEGVTLYVGCDLSRLDLYVGIRIYT